ncbi:hypothetical protein BLM14_19790 (plasmid) [Phyllobacterium zundukense]|nr:hypothetical protein BLM14_19790 [Phyllobacterium zundukense]
MTLIIVIFIVIAIPVAAPLAFAFAFAITASIFNIYPTLNVALAVAVVAISFDNPLAHHAVVG